VSLFPSLRTPDPPPGIDLRRCDVAEMLADVRGARLIVADPPWAYDREAGVANPGTRGIFDVLTMDQIVAHLDAAHDAAGPACRLAVWYTWPKAAEWTAAGLAGPRWGSVVTGGTWTKQAPSAAGARMVQPGVGYHWRGQSEPVAVFTRGVVGPCRELLLNAHVSPPHDHSEKPVEWLRAWVRAWTDPGDLVVDVYAGLAPLARACAAEGRRYVGAEIDTDRHAEALVRLRRYVSM